jgi:hypothetical protein
MSTDLCTLCAELADALLCWQTDGAWIDQAEQSRLITRARAALAQTKPVALTDEDLPMPAAIRDMPEQQQRWYALGWRAAQARWGTPAIEPVPVSERAPRTEDCDAEGRCWWWHPDHKEDDFDDGWILLNPKWADGRHDSDNSPIYTHWLPPWALPVPTPNNTINQED